MSNSVRRSGRTRKNNMRYTNEGWDANTLELLRGSDSSEPDQETPAARSAQESSDDDFDAAQTAVEEQEDETESAASPSVHSSASSSPHTRHTPEGGPSKATEALATPTKQQTKLKRMDHGFANHAATKRTVNRKKSTAQRAKAPKQEIAVHTRGLAELRWKFGRAAQYSAIFGPELDDLKDVLRARDLWVLNGRDAILPSRATMSLISDAPPDALPVTGERDSDVSPAHYELLDDLIRPIQRLETSDLTTLEAGGYVAQNLLHHLVLGPKSREQVFELRSKSSIQLGEAWPRCGGLTGIEASNDGDMDLNVLDDASRVESHNDNASSSAYHEGWLINIGSGVRHLSWASASNPSDQYLAVVYRSTAAQIHKTQAVEHDRAPAFSRSANYPASIQIWRFSAETSSKSKNMKLSAVKSPRLAHIFALKSGDVRQICWLPSPSKRILESALGVLVTLSTDGLIRLISIPRVTSTRTIPECFQVTTAGIKIEPPGDAIFTSFACASAVDLIVGASNGSIRLYNLGQISGNTNPQPYNVFHLHTSYVLTLSIAQHDGFSPFLASASAAGDLALTDLRSPMQDRVTISKARLPTKNLYFSSHARSWITTVDASGRTDASSVPETRIVAYPLRQFFTSHLVSRHPQGTGSATVLAGSTVHPFILTGSTKGTVICQNVLRRLIPTSHSARLKPWTQKVCEYDWIPQQPEMTKEYDNRARDGRHTNASNDAAAKPSNLLYYGRDTRPGISRFHEGFKPEYHDSIAPSAKGAKAKPDSKSETKRKRPADRSRTSDFIVDDDADEDDDAAEDAQTEQPVNEQSTEQDVGVEPIFEEEQAVTAIAWNENVNCATWAAMGWGSGLLRVQDLGHDAGNSGETAEKSKSRKKK